MPLLPGKENIGHNIREMEAAGHPHDQSVAASLRKAYGPPHRGDGGGLGNPAFYIRDEARGLARPMHTGPLMGSTPGRADHLPIAVPSGSYVIPAAAVSHVGQGNTAAGMKKLDGIFAGPYGMRPPKMGGHGMAKPPQMPKAPPLPKYAEGGGIGEPIEIMASDGEYVLSPEQVAHVGDGDIKHGHAVLDKFVNHINDDIIKTAKNYPGPAQD